MKTNIKNYFAGANTCKGFYSLYDSALAGLDRIFIIKGGPGTGKSTVMRNIGIDLVERGHKVEYLVCSSDPNSLDGIIVRSIGVGIVDGTAPHVIEPKHPGIVEEIVNLGEYWNRDVLLKHKLEITDISKRIQDHFRKAYECFEEAYKVYDGVDQEQMNWVNDKKLETTTKNLVTDLFKDYSPPFIRRMFLGANTPEGYVEYIDSITKDVDKRYILKGQPKSAKSLILKKIAEAAEERGFDLEIYHCALNPEHYDMVMIPKLDVAIIDGEHFYTIDTIGKSDVIIPIRTAYEVEDKKIVEQKIEKNLGHFRNLMKLGTEQIAMAKQLHQEKEKVYIEAMDFDKVNDKKLEILREILSLEKVAKTP